MNSIKRANFVFPTLLLAACSSSKPEALAGPGGGAEETSAIVYDTPTGVSWSDLKWQDITEMPGAQMALVANDPQTHILAGYFKAGGPEIDPWLVRRACARAHFRRLNVPFRRLQIDWPEQMRATLDRIQQLLEESDR